LLFTRSELHVAKPISKKLLKYLQDKIDGGGRPERLQTKTCSENKPVISFTRATINKMRFSSNTASIKPATYHL